jgi:hypothetical protein
MYVIWVFWETRQEWTPEITCATAEAAMRAVQTLRRETEGAFGGVWFPGVKVKVKRSKV